MSWKGWKLKGWEKRWINTVNLWEHIFKAKCWGVLRNFRIGGRYWWVTDRGAIGKIENDKKAIQCEKSLRRRMLIEVMVDDSTSLTSFRANRLDVGRDELINWKR